MAQQYRSKLQYEIIGKGGTKLQKDPVIIYKETVTKTETGKIGLSNGSNGHHNGSSKTTAVAYNNGDAEHGKETEVLQTAEQNYARFLKRYTTKARLPEGCLYSSESHCKEAKGADIVDGGASARAAARIEIEKRSHGGTTGSQSPRAIPVSFIAERIEMFVLLKMVG